MLSTAVGLCGLPVGSVVFRQVVWQDVVQGPVQVVRVPRQMFMVRAAGLVHDDSLYPTWALGMCEGSWSFVPAWVR